MASVCQPEEVLTDNRWCYISQMRTQKHASRLSSQFALGQMEE